MTNVAPPAPTVLPAGWVTIEPSEERLRCANHARDEWRIAIENGTVQIAKAATPEPSTGPAPPFALPPQPELRGRRHVLAVAGGFLVGFDADEWGGALYWFASDGGQQRKLAGENVRGLVSLGPDTALAIEGLAHLSISEGAVRWLERKHGAFEATTVGSFADEAIPIDDTNTALLSPQQCTPGSICFEGIGLTIHPHPTLGEGMMEAAMNGLGHAIHILNREQK